jgi:hypothetical protein
MRRFTRPFLAAALVVALAAFAPTLAGTNNLTQIGIAQHSGGPDTLRQIGIALHDGGTYLAGDGSVRTIPGDGSVRLISIGGGTQEAFCFHNVQTVGTIQDGTSNTIFLGEDVGLAVVPTSTSGLAPVRGILDGTSNTITFPESTNFCMGGVTDVDVVPGGDLAGGDNGVFLGDGSSFDLCVGSAFVSAPITDGTSNTILLGETRSNVCFNNIVVSGDLPVTLAAAPEPGSLALLLPAMLGVTALGHGMRRARPRIA